MHSHYFILSYTLPLLVGGIAFGFLLNEVRLIWRARNVELAAMTAPGGTPRRLRLWNWKFGLLSGLSILGLGYVFDDYFGVVKPFKLAADTACRIAEEAKVSRPFPHAEVRVSLKSEISCGISCAMYALRDRPQAILVVDNVFRPSKDIPVRPIDRLRFELPQGSIEFAMGSTENAQCILPFHQLHPHFGHLVGQCLLARPAPETPVDLTISSPKGKTVVTKDVSVYRSSSTATDAQGEIRFYGQELGFNSRRSSALAWAHIFDGGTTNISCGHPTYFTHVMTELLPASPSPNR